MCASSSPVPELMAPPEVSGVSSTSLKVTWSSTEGGGVIARGNVTEYRINLLTEQTNNPYAPPVISQVRHTYTHTLMQRVFQRWFLKKTEDIGQQPCLGGLCGL